MVCGQFCDPLLRLSGTSPRHAENVYNGFPVRVHTISDCGQVIWIPTIVPATADQGRQKSLIPSFNSILSFTSTGASFNSNPLSTRLMTIVRGGPLPFPLPWLPAR